MPKSANLPVDDLLMTEPTTHDTNMNPLRYKSMMLSVYVKMHTYDQEQSMPSRSIVGKFDRPT